MTTGPARHADKSEIRTALAWNLASVWSSFISHADGLYTCATSTILIAVNSQLFSNRFACEAGILVATTAIAATRCSTRNLVVEATTNLYAHAFFRHRLRCGSAACKVFFFTPSCCARWPSKLTVAASSSTVPVFPVFELSGGRCLISSSLRAHDIMRRAILPQEGRLLLVATAGGSTRQ